MGLRDITGVFSRYFIVGFFIPSLFTLVLLERLLSGQAVPNALEAYGEDTRILILGAMAVFVGLVLMGLQSFPLELLFVAGPLRTPLVRLQVSKMDRLRALRNDASAPQSARARAALEITRRFGGGAREAVQPTRLGNAARSYAASAYARWGLDAVAVWPRVEALMTEQERELHVDAKTDVAFFLNGSLGCLVIGLAALVDGIAYRGDALFTVVLVAVSLLFARFLYLAGVGAATRWSERREASFDLHRGDILTSFGFRDPTGFEDGRTIGIALSRFLLYGVPPGDELLAAATNRDRDTERVAPATPSAPHKSDMLSSND